MAFLSLRLAKAGILLLVLYIAAAGTFLAFKPHMSMPWVAAALK
jgi:hypothetical protein